LQFIGIAVSAIEGYCTDDDDDEEEEEDDTSKDVED